MLLNQTDDIKNGDKDIRFVYYNTGIIWERSAGETGEMTDTPPVTFTGRAGKLVDYKIWGNEGGVGVLDGTDYVIPITVTKAQSQNQVNINIGDTPLNSDEYVSYQEQKIYRYANEPFDLVIDDTHVFYGVTIAVSASDGTLTATGTCKYDTCMTICNGITYLGANINTVSIQTAHAFAVENGKTYKFSCPNSAGGGASGKVQLLVGKSTASIRNSSNRAILVQDGESFTPSNSETYCMPVFYELLDQVYSGSTMPSLSSVDSVSAQLPAISVLGGTSTLSVDTTVQPEKMYIKYQKQG